MHFATGVVEDVNDPKKLGRVRVRLNGIHSPDKVQNLETGEGIPTDMLPWATPIQNIQSAALNQKGDTPVGLLVGTWVAVMSVNDSFDVLFIMGSIAGMGDINKLALGEETDLVSNKKSNLYKTEPATKYAAEYPHNRVIETPGGTIIELDDTPGAERIHVYHKSGSFIEIHPDGVKVDKVVGDNYSISLKDNNLLVKGVINIISEGDCNITTSSNCTITSGEDCTIKSSGNTTIDVGGKAKIKSKDAIIDASGNVEVKAGGSASVEGSSVTVKGSGSVLIAGGSVTLKGRKTVNI